MPQEKPVIELEPKNSGPFRWTVFLALVVVWIVVLVLAFSLKSAMLRMLWPVLLLILVVYLAVCTFVLFRNRK